MINNKIRCGYVGIIGRPNVGKSTLLNTLIGEKISIVTNKAHTTRDNILGVLNTSNNQIIFVDTPGLQLKRKALLNQLMAKSINQAIIDSDLIIFMIEASRITKQDYMLRDSLVKLSKKTILAINKIDNIKDKSDLLPFLSKVQKEFDFLSYIPISSKKNINLDRLINQVINHLPEAPIIFRDNFITDKDKKYRVEEIIREKLMNSLHEEIPYGLKVKVEHMGEEDSKMHIHAIILINKESHKSIVIGKRGKVLKNVGTLARKEINLLFGIRSHIELWVKTTENWSDSTSSQFNLDIIHE
jgi:GTP-binding protein Era